MTEILQMFSGNPLATFIGKKIEAATRQELETDDWALNLEICDMINENDDDAKDAARAIKKRLQQIEQDVDFSVTNKTLTVLETCVSNCSRRFHVLVMTKDFILDLVKLIGPKNNPPIDLQERVLRLIERWAEAFKNQPDLGGVVTVYNDLKAKGVTFPERDPNSNVPIQTPQRTIAPQSGTSSTPPPTGRSASGRSHHHRQPQPAGPIVLEGDGYNKISQDLGVVQSSIDMFNDIMSLLEVGSADSDWKLAADLNSTCRQMKERIVDLIERVANEDLTIELLRLNDDLNNIFIKYDRLVKNKYKSSIQQQQQQAGQDGQKGSTASALLSMPSTVLARREQTVNELSLIDFDAGEAGDTQREAQTTVSDSFDTSAVDRIASSGGKTISSATKIATSSTGPPQPPIDSFSRLKLDGQGASGLPEEISSVREQDFAEIENWLSTDSGRNLASIGADMPSIEPVSIQNSDFETFLANRAMAGESAAPNKSANSSSQPPKAGPSN